MKPITAAASLILAAFALHAAIPQQAKDAGPAKPDAATHTATLFSAPQPTAVTDSPLVRAAKASRRPGLKASTVITNETLVRTGGHFTTTSSQQPIPAASGPKPQTEVEWLAEMHKRASDAAANAAAARKSEELKKVAAARKEQLMEGDTPEAIYNDPPPLEGIQTNTPATQIQPMKPTAPPTMETKPPL
jgi:hypothetical protein